MPRAHETKRCVFTAKMDHRTFLSVLANVSSEREATIVFVDVSFRPRFDDNAPVYGTLTGINERIVRYATVGRLDHKTGSPTTTHVFQFIIRYGYTCALDIDA